MGERVSEAAGRVVDKLSRRRFLRWVGGGGAALAAGFGFDLFQPRALAQGESCNTIRRTITLQRGDRVVGRIACVEPGQCNFAPDAVLQNLCELRFQTDCDAGTHCNPPHKCRAIAFAGNNVVVECRSRGRDGCPEGMILCQCTVRVRGGFPSGAVVCRCECQ